jgi:hypothetical protein
VASRKVDILILSSAIGSGHMRASVALTQGVALLEPERVCLTVDFPREVSPTMEALLRRVYLESLKLMPDVYGRIYRMSELRAARHGTAYRASDAYDRMHRISELWVNRYEPMHPASAHLDTRRRHERSGLRTLKRLVEETGAKVLVAPHFYGAAVLGNYKGQNQIGRAHV